LDEYQAGRIEAIPFPTELAWGGASAASLPAVDESFRIPPLVYWSAGAIALGAGGFWLLPPLRGALLLPLFTRIDRKRIADHQTRGRILSLVSQRPGIPQNEIAPSLGISSGAARHHIRQLVRARALREVRGAGCVGLVLPEDAAQPRSMAEPFLKSRGASNILSALVARPGLSGAELAAATGLDRATVHYHLKRLANAGLVSVEREGNAIRASATDVGRACALA
jgi:DNA-binding transcriptional ArsR family regulator